MCVGGGLVRVGGGGDGGGLHCVTSSCLKFMQGESYWTVDPLLVPQVRLQARHGSRLAARLPTKHLERLSCRAFPTVSKFHVASFVPLHIAGSM